MSLALSLLDKEILDVGEKRCSQCQEVKSVTEFNKNPHTLDGYSGYCKRCQRKYDKKRYEVSVTEKQCSRCGKVKPAEEFRKNTRARTGLDSECRECRKLYWREMKFSLKNRPAQKRCAWCGVIKPSSEFHKRVYSRDGLSSRCKKCRSAEGRTRYQSWPVGDSSKKKPRFRIDNEKQVDEVIREIAETQLVINDEVSACNKRVAAIIQDSSETLEPHRRRQSALRLVLNRFFGQDWLRGDQKVREYRFGTVTLIRDGKKGGKFKYDLNLELARERLGKP